MSRPPATLRKVGRVLVLLALFLACQRAAQTARALLGAGAVQFPRSVPPGIWARNLLVARRAEADGTLDGGEAEDEEDDKGPREDDNENKDEQLQENKEAPAKESELTFKNYDEQMVRELRELCRARGLPSNGTKAELKAALAKDDEERRPVEAKAASVKDAEPEAAVQAGVPVRQRRVWLQVDVEGNPYDVFLGADAIGADLRHLATPDVSDRQRANVKLFKSDGTELDLDGKVPLDAGSSSKSPVRIEGAPSSEFQAARLGEQFQDLILESVR